MGDRLSGWPYDALPLWDGAAPPPVPVPTSPYTRDAAGRWRVRGRFARMRWVTAEPAFDFVLRRAYADMHAAVMPMLTPLLATLKPSRPASTACSGSGIRWSVRVAS